MALAIIMVVAMVFPAIAAEQKKLTYDERVAKIKEVYGITYGPAKYHFTDKAHKDFNLDWAEDALPLLGAKTIKTIIAPWVKANGAFYLQYGTNNADSFEGLKERDWSNVPGVCYGGSITFIQSKDNYHEQKKEWKWKTYLPEVLVHEFGHSYDDGLLGMSGSAALAKYNKDNGLKELYGGTNEEFAYLFGRMITMSSIDEDTELPRISGSRDKFEIIYNFMVRDFGEDSISVKRAAKFLGKELPKK